jgi:NADP-dependent 3-hydroxy acid dehydrogenase YdfG
MASNPRYKVWASMRSTEFWDLPPSENVRLTQLDVTDDESVTNAVGRVVEEDGKVDIVINSAGYGVFGSLEAVSINDAKVLID